MGTAKIRDILVCEKKPGLLEKPGFRPWKIKVECHGLSGNPSRFAREESGHTDPHTVQILFNCYSQLTFGLNCAKISLVCYSKDICLMGSTMFPIIVPDETPVAWFSTRSTVKFPVAPQIDPYHL